MELRQNPKQKSIHDIGTARSYKNYNEKKLRNIWHVKCIEKEAAIKANMIKLLTVVKSDNPYIHLNFWQENLRSEYPVIEIKQSNLVHGGVGVFATDNCIFLPKGLIFIPHSNTELQETPAPPGSKMSNYQFAVKCENKTYYLFPTLEVNASLPCAQFINTPLRKKQGYYDHEVRSTCKQAMHIGNVKLFGKPPGGFRSHKIIYPGFEILGSYMSSYRLPRAIDYWENRKNYNDEWIKETRKANTKQRSWISKIKKKNQTKIKEWINSDSILHCKLTQAHPILNLVDSTESEDDEDDDFVVLWKSRLIKK